MRDLCFNLDPSTFNFRMGEITLEQTIVALLREKGKCLSTAESCTGGYLAHRITLVPGSSEVFHQGWVTYSDHAKVQMLGVPSHFIQEHGDVSEPVVRAMAKGALQKSGSDYAIGVTGIAGPSGGTKEKPVGTVWIALASKKRTDAKHFLFEMDRETFKIITTQTALDMLRRELLRTE